MENKVMSKIGRGSAWKLSAHPWAIHPSGYTRVEQMATDIMAAAPAQPKGMALVMKILPGGVAVMKIFGVLVKDASWYGDTTYDDIVEAAETLRKDPSIKAVFIDVDSPGGSSLGCIEAAEAIQALSVDKQHAVMAYTDQMAASAAYWISAGAGAIASAKSAYTGSIGTYTFFADQSGWLEQLGIKVEAFHNKEGDLKTTWLPWTSLTEAQRADIQDYVQKAHGNFDAFVDENRTLVEGTKRGQVFLAGEALERGVIDMIGTRDEAMAFLVNRMGG